MFLTKNRDVAIAIVLVAVLLTLVLIAIPINFPAYFNFDEVIEVTRVHLLQRHYIFYKEVWSDHPLGLSRIFQFFSNFIQITLPSARYIVLLLSSIHVVIFFYLLRFYCNPVPSAIAASILMTSYQYILLSGSALNEIPALTFVVLSLLLMRLYVEKPGKRSYIYLLLSSLFFVLSIEVKLSGVIALPSLVAIGISGKKGWIGKFKDAGVWLVTSLSVFLFFTITILPFSYYNLIGFHTGTSDKFATTDPSLTLATLLDTSFQQDTIYAFLTLFAIGTMFWKRNKTDFLPPLLLLGFNLLRFYKTLPVWPTYYVHLALPAAWLIGLMLARLDFKSAFSAFRERRLSFSGLILPMGILLALFLQLAVNTFKIATAQHPKRYRNPALVSYHEIAKQYQPNPAEAILAPYRGSHKMILTDNPYFIYEFELDTPPETAILSRKRVIAEDLDGEFILEIIRKRKPDFVLLDRFADKFMESKALSDFLEEHYSESLLKDSRARLFIVKP